MQGCRRGVITHSRSAAFRNDNGGIWGRGLLCHFPRSVRARRRGKPFRLQALPHKRRRARARCCGDRHACRRGQFRHARLPFLDARHDHGALFGRSAAQFVLVALDGSECIFTLDPVLRLSFEQSSARNCTATLALFGVPWRGARAQLPFRKRRLLVGASLQIGGCLPPRQALLARREETVLLPDLFSLCAHAARVDRCHLAPCPVGSVAGDHVRSQLVILAPGSTVGDGHLKWHTPIDSSRRSGGTSAGSIRAGFDHLARRLMKSAVASRQSIADKGKRRLRNISGAFLETFDAWLCQVLPTAPEQSFRL